MYAEMEARTKLCIFVKRVRHSSSPSVINHMQTRCAAANIWYLSGTCLLQGREKSALLHHRRVVLVLHRYCVARSVRRRAVIRCVAPADVATGAGRGGAVDRSGEVIGVKTCTSTVLLWQPAQHYTDERL